MYTAVEVVVFIVVVVVIVLDVVVVVNPWLGRETSSLDEYLCSLLVVVSFKVLI